MLNFEELKGMNIPQNASDWMESYGTNHINLIKAWKKDPEVMNDVEFLTDCLAWAIQHKRREPAKRIMSKISKLRGDIEKCNLELALSKPKPMSKVADCLL